MSWYPPVVTTAPAEEPVTLEDAKRWGRIEDAADDDRVTDALEAARAAVEAQTGTCLVEQTVEVKCDGICDLASIPLAPVQSVVVKYIDWNGAEQTLADTVYELRSEGLQTGLKLKFGQSWPVLQGGSRVTVTAVCGYADGEVPPQVLQAIRIKTIAELDGRRDPEDVAAVEALLANHRRFV